MELHVIINEDARALARKVPRGEAGDSDVEVLVWDLFDAMAARRNVTTEAFISLLSSKSVPDNVAPILTAHVARHLQRVTRRAS